MYFYRYWCNIGNVVQHCIYCPYWHNITFIGQRKPQTPNVGAINVVRYWRNIFSLILVQHWKCCPTLHILPLLAQYHLHCPILAQYIFTDIGATLEMLANVAYIATILAQYRFYWPISAIMFNIGPI